ncbi:MAG: hypothetical protein ABIP27_20965 [Flavobacterium circumlabens]
MNKKSNEQLLTRDFRLRGIVFNLRKDYAKKAKRLASILTSEYLTAIQY